MAILTDDEKKAIENQRFVILRSNVGQYQQGEVVTGRQLDPSNTQRLLWGKHVREATPLEAGLAKVTLQDDEDQHLSYEYRMSVLEQENRKLRRDLVSASERCELLESQARPRQASPDEQGAAKLLVAKERRVAEAEGELNRLKQEVGELRRDNEQLLEKVMKFQDSAGRNEPPPRPAPGTPGAEDRPQQAAGQKTPSPGDARPTPPDRKPR
jgi:hypothetical protein